MKKRILSLLLACFMIVSTIVITVPHKHVHAVEYTEGTNQWTLDPTDFSETATPADSQFSLTALNIGYYTTNALEKMTNGNYAWRYGVGTIAAESNTNGINGTSSGWDQPDFIYNSASNRIEIQPKRYIRPTVVFTAPSDGSYYFNVDITKAFDDASGREVRSVVSLVAVKQDGSTRVIENYTTAASANDTKVLEGVASLKEGEKLYVIVDRCRYDGDHYGHFWVYLNSMYARRLGDIPQEHTYQENVDQWTLPTDFSTSFTNGNFSIGLYNYGYTETLTPISSTASGHDWTYYLNTDHASWGVRAMYKSTSNNYITLGPNNTHSPFVKFTAPEDGVYFYAINVTKGFWNASGDVVRSKITVRSGDKTLESYATLKVDGDTELLIGTVELKKDESIELIAQRLTTGNLARHVYLDVNSFVVQKCTHTGVADATCKTAVPCTTCGVDCLNPDNHEQTSAYYDKEDGTHGKKYPCCNAVDTTFTAEAHNVSSGNCVCGLTHANAGHTVAWTTTDTQHTPDCEDCEYAGTAENHVWNGDNACDTCNFTCDHDGYWNSTTGICSNCGTECDHPSWDANGCTVCGIACNHTGGTATCTSKKECTTCGQEYGDLDANNHTGSIKYSNGTANGHVATYDCGCNTVVTNDTAHVWGDDNECDKCEYKCENHDWDEGTCTICGTECDHPSWNANGCTVCGVACNHTGGTATCTSKKECTTCGQEYGDLDANNHTGSIKYSNGTANGHVATYDCGCNTVVTNDTAHVWGDDNECDKCEYKCENHDWDEGTCTICGTECDHPSWNANGCTVCGVACNHTGGTATCTSKKECTTCGQEYGDLDANNHTGSIKYSNGTANGHVATYDCGCNTVVTNDTAHVWGDDNECDKCEYKCENHDWDEGTCTICGTECDHPSWDANGCTVCGVDCNHTGGTATCNSKKECDTCGQEYGDVDADNHAGTTKTYTDAGDEHVAEWDCCNIVDADDTEHNYVDGVCEDCDHECEHEGETPKYTVNGDKHSAKYDCCGKVTVSEEAHDFSAGNCVCGATKPAPPTGDTGIALAVALIALCGSGIAIASKKRSKR